MNRFYKVSYKGKWFIIQDKQGIYDLFLYRTMLSEDGTITKKEALNTNFIKKHKDLCKYYGIPAYIGKDKDLNKVYKQ